MYGESDNDCHSATQLPEFFQSKCIYKALFKTKVDQTFKNKSNIAKTEKRVKPPTNII